MIVDGKIFPYKNKLKKLFRVAETVLNEDFDNVSISLNFVSDDEIKRLNNMFRGNDNVTDVLSFPNLNKSINQKLVEFESEKDIDDGILFLGDIVICKSKAKAQAKDYGHSQKREICFLALHGFLHLLGYDHINPEDEKTMQQMADRILKEFGVNR